jgi:ABC-2 type transport system permease protein
MVAFIAAGFSCFLLYTGFHAISRIPAMQAGADYYVDMLGIDYHYRNMSRGIITLRDGVYFISVILFFLSLTRLNLTKR